MAEHDPNTDNVPEPRELGIRAAGGQDQLDTVIDWASQNLPPDDKAHYNRLLQNPATAEAAVQQLAGFAGAANANASAGTGTTAKAGTGPAPSPATARRETGQAGAIVTTAPAGYHASHLQPVQQPGPATPPGGNVTTPEPGTGTGTGFRTSREMRRAMDEADAELGDWRKDQALLARLNVTPADVRTATG